LDVKLHLEVLHRFCVLSTALDTCLRHILLFAQSPTAIFILHPAEAVAGIPNDPNPITAATIKAETLLFISMILLLSFFVFVSQL
jgi:hypothetical protein